MKDSAGMHLRRTITVIGTLALILTLGGVVNAAGNSKAQPAKPARTVYVDLTSNQKIIGAKTFSKTITGNISGTANKAESFTGALHGDVTGTQNKTSVTSLRGIPVSGVAPSIGEMLTFDGNQWAAKPFPASFVDLASNQKITGAKTFAKTITGNISGTANTAESFTGALHGDVTGTQNSTRVTSLQGVPVSGLAPRIGQMLTFDGKQWAAKPFQASAPGPAPAVNTSRIAVNRNYQKNLTAYDVGLGDGTTPYGLAYDGAHLWVADQGSGGVTRIDLFDGSRIPQYFGAAGPGSPLANCKATALTYDGSRVWVLCGDGGNVKLVAIGGNLAGAYNVGPHPLTENAYVLPGVSSPDAIAFDGRHLWIANEGNGTLTIVGDSAGAGGGDPAGDILCGFDPNDANAPNGDYGPQIGLNAPNTAPGEGAGPTALVFDGDNMWVADGNSNQVARISDGQVAQYANPYTCPEPRQYINVPADPAGLTVAAGNIWVVSRSASALTEVAWNKGVWSAGTPVQMANVGPHYIIFDGNDLWISSEQGYVYEYNPFTHGFVAPAVRMPLTSSGQPDPAMGMAFDGTNVWVARKHGNAVRML